jgi:membrane protein YqaA with SNARE-associated domain
MHRLVLWIQRVLVPLLGAPGMCLVAFLDSSFLSFPEVNDILLVTSSHLHPGRALLYVGMTTLGSVVGCVIMWELGRRGGEAFFARRFGAGSVERTRTALAKWGVLSLALPAVLPPPMPFKIFVVAAGVFGVSRRKLILTLTLARGLRYAFWAGMGVFYGDAALGWLDRFDDWFLRHWAQVVLALGGIVVVFLLVFWAKGLRARPSAGEA